MDCSRIIASWFVLACLLFPPFPAPVRAAAVLGIGQNFTGSTYGVESVEYPPDSTGAAGPDHFVEFINGRFSVYSKSNGVRVQTMSDRSFWSQAGVSLAANFMVSDPRL